MNTFVVAGLVSEVRSTQKFMSIVVREPNGVAHELLAFSSMVKRYENVKRGCRVVASAERKLNSGTDTQFWMLKSCEVTQLPALQISKED